MSKPWDGKQELKLYKTELGPIGNIGTFYQSLKAFLKEKSKVTMKNKQLPKILFKN